MNVDVENIATQRADALMRKLGGMSLAQAIANGDAGSLPCAARLVDVWFSRSLTHAEHVQARQAAERLGIDLDQFDKEQCK